MNNPKLFISYSWTSPNHEARVLALASELVDNGVNVIFDKWDLREGQDAYAFMESMVRDPEVTKVLLVCDSVYVRKADERSGGVGTEAQILSPDLYRQRDQTKFVALVLERDDEGKPLVPTYYASRVYIDYTEPGKEAESFEQLLRWAYDRPLHVKPTLGERPAFLDESATSVRMRTATQLRRAQSALREDRANATAIVGDYLDEFAKELEHFRIGQRTEPWDEAVLENIDAFIPYRNQLINLFDDLARHRPGQESTRLVQRFLEKLLQYTFRPIDVNQWRETDFDNFRFIVHEVFLYLAAIEVRHERFEDLARVLASEFYCPHQTDYGKADMRSYGEFYHSSQTFEQRNTRLNLNRLSLQADLLKERCKDLPVSFANLMQADFLLFLRAQVGNTYARWWPSTLVYVGHFASRFEVFARARSASYFESLRPVLGVRDVTQLKTLAEEFTTGTRRAPRWQYESIDVATLSGADELCSLD